MNNVELSKEISYALRHAPEQYGLKLDSDGWADLEKLLGSLKEDRRFFDVTELSIIAMIEETDKKRHEITDGKIRAVYGHSIDTKIIKEPTQPPDLLYHGTAHKFKDSIWEIGLVSKERQYVHLSEDIDTAIIVGKRKDTQPIILKINSKQAWNDGILFYAGTDKIWLADSISVKYLSLAK